MIKAASILDDNPADAQAVQQVCTACHSSSQFLTTPRSSSRWEQVFSEMSGFGADPSDAQVAGIVRYFQRNLMVVNVNTSPAEELAPTLQIDQTTAGQIVARREVKKFSSVDDLASTPGVSRDVLVKLRDKLQF